MKTKIIEATNGEKNWGKFMVMQPDHKEWSCTSKVLAEYEETVAVEPRQSHRSLLLYIGWSINDIIVFDLQTGEGARFRPSGSPLADLGQKQVWVCPLFEPFLTWLYAQPLEDIEALPDRVDLPGAPFALRGYRRGGAKR